MNLWDCSRRVPTIVPTEGQGFYVFDAGRSVSATNPLSHVLEALCKQAKAQISGHARKRLACQGHNVGSPLSPALPPGHHQEQGEQICRAGRRKLPAPEPRFTHATPSKYSVVFSTGTSVPGQGDVIAYEDSRREIEQSAIVARLDFLGCCVVCAGDGASSEAPALAWLPVGQSPAHPGFFGARGARRIRLSARAIA